MNLLSINSQQLHGLLKKAKEVTSKHPTLPVLGNILLKVRRTDVQVVATDLMVTMVATITITNPGDYGWECLLPTEFLYNLCGKLGGEELCIKVTKVEVKRDKEKITVQQAELTTMYGKFKLDELDDPKDYPAVPQFPEGNTAGVGGDFIQWMNRACDAVSPDGLRPVLQKIYLDLGYDGITMVATDAHILTEKRFEGEHPGRAELLVSTKIAKALAGFVNTTISWSETHVGFVSDGMVLMGTLQDEKYVNYKAVVPLPAADSDLLKIGHGELKTAMEKMALVSEIVKFNLKGKAVEVEAVDVNYGRSGKEELLAKYAGQIDTVYLNANTVLRLLKTMTYATLSLHINTATNPILVTSDSDPTWRGFIMPVHMTVK